MKFIYYIVLLVALMTSQTALAGKAGKQETDEVATVTISAESMSEAGIVVNRLKMQQLNESIRAPGEVKLNSYLSSTVTPRITAQVISRHVKLGDTVTKDQPLLTLSSVAMAEAVGELLVARQEWERVQKLGKAVISDKRYNAAQVAENQLKAKVIAYGMTSEQVQSLYQKGAGDSLGVFQLLSPREGVIVSDNFIEGELIEPGKVLFDIVNESVLWVESHLSPQQSDTIASRAPARIYLSDNSVLEGTVIQKHHLLDEDTRTIRVRIEVDNQQDFLHPGMYVETEIQTKIGEQALAVPTEAILRSADGDWVVFIEQGTRGSFSPREVVLIKTINDYTVIAGLPEGINVVVAGAFFVQSEFSKSNFSIHGH